MADRPSWQLDFPSCNQCGACCRAAGGHLGLPAKPDGSCGHLVELPGRAVCAIYEARPAFCRVGFARPLTGLSKAAYIEKQEQACSVLQDLFPPKEFPMGGGAEVNADAPRLVGPDLYEVAFSHAPPSGPEWHKTSVPGTHMPKSDLLDVMAAAEAGDVAAFEAAWLASPAASVWLEAKAAAPTLAALVGPAIARYGCGGDLASPWVTG